MQMLFLHTLISGLLPLLLASVPVGTEDTTEQPNLSLLVIFLCLSIGFSFHITPLGVFLPFALWGSVENR